MNLIDLSVETGFYDCVFISIKRKKEKFSISNKGNGEEYNETFHPEVKSIFVMDLEVGCWKLEVIINFHLNMFSNLFEHPILYFWNYPCSTVWNMIVCSPSPIVLYLSSYLLD